MDKDELIELIKQQNQNLKTEILIDIEKKYSKIQNTKGIEMGFNSQIKSMMGRI